jgi:nanoRNase/pAp phosphatase (c-di-AMP/oligoRNAs hydrolase)
VEVYGPIGFMRLDSPDDSLLGAASDIVLSLETVAVVVAYSVREKGVKFSVRSESKEVKANGLVRSMLEGIGFGGGHDHMAGGFIPAESIPVGRNLDTYIKHRAILFVEQGSRVKGA